jgi:ABC-type glycerol-3-phosphate transport system permease component
MTQTFTLPDSGQTSFGDLMPAAVGVAGTFISMVVPLIVFFALQRYFVRGLLAGSVKG